ncbi:MAG: hypothetical protein KAU38_15080, partial [Desulfobacterales bacterium]|nr:hypothetical protein [Desulfobacterales bacterium]
AELTKKAQSDELRPFSLSSFVSDKPLEEVSKEIDKSIEDVQLWEEKGREDILEWVDPILLGDGQFVYDIWISPRTGDDVNRCPWLRKLPKRNKYICRIHDVKPEHCRKYPQSKKHAEETGCKGFEKVR